MKMHSNALMKHKKVSLLLCGRSRSNELSDKIALAFITITEMLLLFLNLSFIRIKIRIEIYYIQI